MTKEISIPALVSSVDPLELKADFEIDRSEFGMDYGVDKVAKEVAMTVTISQ